MIALGSSLYDTRGCLALALAVMQGMPHGEATAFAGTKASMGKMVNSSTDLKVGMAVVWIDKNLARHSAQIMLLGSSRVRVKFSQGPQKWVTRARLIIVSEEN